MNLKFIRPYTSPKHFEDSTRDSFYEFLLDDDTIISVVRCDDRNSRHVGEVEIVGIGKHNSKNFDETLKKMGYSLVALTEKIEQILSAQ